MDNLLIEICWIDSTTEDIFCMKCNSELQNLAVRERHWVQLIEATKRQLNAKHHLGINRLFTIIIVIRHGLYNIWQSRKTVLQQG